MKKFKKVLAVVTALTMAITPMPVLADSVASSSSSGEGYLEGVAPTDLYDVVLPYVADGTYKPTLDPTQLLSKYDESGATFTSGASMYFDTGAKNASDKAVYADTSAVATVVNKGTTPVILTVDASVKNATGNALKFVSSGAVTADNNPNVAMSIVPAGKGTVSGSSITGDAITGSVASGYALTVTGQAVVTTGTAASVVTGQAVDFSTDAAAQAVFFIDGSTDNFDIKQESVSTDEIASGHKYSYIAKDDAVWDTVGFAISGQCNTNSTADWSQVSLKENVIKVDVVYTISKMDDTQKTQLYGDDDTLAGSESTATVDATTAIIGGTFTASSSGSSSSTGNTKPIYSKTSGGTINVDETKAVISAVKYGPAADNTPNAATGYTFNSTAHTITLPSGLFANVTVGESRYVQVTYGNGSTEVFEIVIQN